VSPSRRMISPIRFSSPTLTMSNIRAPIMFSAMTAGPEMRWILPSMAIRYLLAFCATCLLELDVEADRASHQLLHIRDRVVLRAERRAEARHAEQHRQVATAHAALAGAHRVGDEPLVDGHQGV